MNPYTTLLGKTGAASEAEAETQIWTEIVMKCVDSSGLVATNVCNAFAHHRVERMTVLSSLISFASNRRPELQHIIIVTI